jgi:anti-sigma regulatory factor (Ser/Thr protein kinase)
VVVLRAEQARRFVSDLTALGPQHEAGSSMENAAHGYANDVPETVDARRGVDFEHVVGFYATDDDLIAWVATQLADALTDDDALVLLATDAHRTALDQVLCECGVPTAQLRRQGRYLSLDAAETLATFMKGAQPNARAFTSAIRAIMHSVRGSGEIRIFGEMVACLWGSGNVHAGIELERLWNTVDADRNVRLYCAYPMSLVDASRDLVSVKRVCDQHSGVSQVQYHASGSTANADGNGTGVARSFLATNESVVLVRDFVRHVISAMGREAILDQAEVIASELATNAVIHARTPFRVAVSESTSAVRIAVEDLSSAHPAALPPDPARIGGRGLWLVSMMAAQWETQATTDGKNVWADIAWNTVSRPPSFHTNG